MAGKARAATSAIALRRTRPIAQVDRVTRPPKALEFEVVRSSIDAAIDSCKGMHKFMADVQRIQARTLHEMDEAVQQSKFEPQAAGELRRLVALQARLTHANVTEAIVSSHRLITRWLEAEARRQRPARPAPPGSEHPAASPPAVNGGRLLH